MNTKYISLIIAVFAVMVIPGQINKTEAEKPVEPVIVPVSVVVPEPTIEVPAPTSTLDVVAVNPQGCDSNKQWIWSDGSCHDKEITVAVATLPARTVQSSCGDNEYAHYIYMHESNCNTNATNWISCYGIGQSCPASKIAHCGADYACQNEWFTNYAITRYGSWYNAYVFWTQNKWW